MDQANIHRVIAIVRHFVPRSVDHESLAIDILVESWQNQIEIPTFFFIKRRCYNALRRLHQEKRYMTQLPLPEPENQDQRIEDCDKIQNLMGILSPFERKVIWYRFYQDYTIIETAKAVKRDVNVTRETIINALFKMRQAGE